MLKHYNKTKADVVDNKITVPTITRYAHNGDDFIYLETDVGRLSIRWSAVVAYRCDNGREIQSAPKRISNPFG